jgi:hypothetical protein
MNQQEKEMLECIATLKLANEKMAELFNFDEENN